MDRYEYKLKLEQLKNLVEEKDFKTAADIADTINWRKVKSAATLCMVGEIYDRCKRYDESHEILLMAYDRAAVGRNILYRLTLVALKMGNLDEAKDYFEEFLEVAPYDNQKYILRYQIEKMSGASIEQLIAILEEFKGREYREEWAFELAYLYHRIGNSERCVEVCDELILFIGDGKYVEKALELKMLYQPLTHTQEQKYREFMQNNEDMVEVHTTDALESGEVVRDTMKIPNITANTGRFNTQNLQAEIAKSMQQIMDANTKETVNDTMDNLKKMVEDIPYLQVPQEEADRAAEEERYGHIETDEEIDDSLKNDFEEMLAEDWDGQFSFSVQGGGVREPQVNGQIGIEEVLADWEKTRMAAEAAMAAAQQKRLESAKARAMQEAWDLLERLHDIIPKLEAGISPKELLEEQYLHNDASKQPEEEQQPGEQIPGEPYQQPGEQISGEPYQQLGEQVSGEPYQQPGEQIPGELYQQPEEEQLPEVQFPWDMQMPEDIQLPKGIQIPEEEQPAHDLESLENAQQLSDSMQQPQAAKLAVEGELPQENTQVNREPLSQDTKPMNVIGQLGDILPAKGTGQPEGAQPAKGTGQLEDAQPAKETGQLEGAQQAKGTEQPEGAQPMKQSEQLPNIQLPEDLQLEQELQGASEAASTWEEAARILGEPIPEEYLQKLREEKAAKQNAEKAGTANELAEEEKAADEFAEKETAAKQAAGKETAAKQAAGKETAAKAAGINKSKGADKNDAGQYLQSVFEAAKASREEKENVSIPKIDIEEPQEHISKLSPEQKKIFSYFVPITGMEQQLCQVLEGALHRKGNDNTSTSGNILIIGGRGSGKTVLATDFIKVIQKSSKHSGGKVGKITGEALNQKELSQLLKKVAGGYLIVEKAGDISKETATKLSLLMEQDTGGLLVLMEDTSKGIKKLLSQDVNLSKKFTERIKIPIFTSDELVEFAKAYAEEQECEIDDMGILALYNRISNIQKLDEATTLTEVKDIVDEAIARAERGGLKKIFGGKKFSPEGYLYLREKDFED